MFPLHFSYSIPFNGECDAIGMESAFSPCLSRQSCIPLVTFRLNWKTLLQEWPLSTFSLLSTEKQFLLSSPLGSFARVESPSWCSRSSIHPFQRYYTDPELILHSHLSTIYDDYYVCLRIVYEQEWRKGAPFRVEGLPFGCYLSEFGIENAPNSRVGNFRLPNKKFSTTSRNLIDLLSHQIGMHVPGTP